jgi:hypothetical protein
MIELMCDCPELQDGHIFRLGDYVHDKGMMHVFGFGSGGEGPRQSGGYIWCQCADKLQRIPTKKELIHFAKLKKRREKKRYAQMRQRYPALEEDFVINWYIGGTPFLLDRYHIDRFYQMMQWAKNLSDDGRISIKYPKKTQPGWWRHPYPQLTYFYTWIPTQKQIQTMLKDQWWSCTDHYVRTEFHRWYNEFQLKHDTWEMTGDEIWVAFYMHRVYNKVWDWKSRNKRSKKKKQWKELVK